MKPDIEHSVHKDAVRTGMLISQNPPIEQIMRSSAMHYQLRKTLGLTPMVLPETLKTLLTNMCRG